MKRSVKRLIIFCMVFNLILIGVIVFCGFKYINEKKNTMTVVAAASNKEPVEIKKSDFINIKEFIPEIIYEPKYKTKNNVTGKILYNKDYSYLRYGTALKLKRAQDEFTKMGIKIKIWDAYRPPSVQSKLWQKVHDPRFIANPATGSVHNRGAAIDMTLVDKDGHEIKMPSEFDEFDSRADRDYSDIDAQSANNAKVLEKIMIENGFVSITTEWWHFNDADYRDYSIVQDVKDTSIKKSGYALEVSGSQIKEPDFKDQLNGFVVWLGEKTQDISVESIIAEVKSNLWKIKGIF